jgi:hypothetical protein
MTETQRQQVPRVDTGELGTALAFLDFVRACAIKKADGLDEAQVRRPLVASGTSVLGLIRHLAVGERYWFGHQVAGRYAGVEWDFGLDVDGASSAVVDDYRTAIAESNAIIRELGDPEALSVHPVDGQRKTLRWVLAHMTGETARHAGHADILRELIDGTTGR